MFPSLSHVAVSSYALNMTVDFTPLFVGLVVLFGLSALGIAFAIGVHDTREEDHEAHVEGKKLLTVPKAA